MSDKKSSPLFTFDPRYKENLFGSGGTPEGEAPPARVLMEPREYLPVVPLGEQESSEPVSFGGSEPGVWPDLPLRHMGVLHELKEKTAKKATTGGRRRGQKTHRRKGKKSRRGAKKSRRGAKKSRRH